MTIPDPQNIPRTTLNRRPSRIAVCRLRETPPEKLETRMTWRYLLTLAFSLLLGSGCAAIALQLFARGENTSGILASVFGALYLGFTLLAFRGTRSRLTVFDRQTGTFRKRDGAAICPLDQIAALQLLPPGTMRRNGEINLVLTDGTRHHVLAFPDEDAMQQDAALLSRWLGGTVIWQNGGI